MVAPRLTTPPPRTEPVIKLQCSFPQARLSFTSARPGPMARIVMRALISLPKSDNASMGWTLKGYCDGTISPTAAPIVYAPPAKCRWYNGTQAVTISPWAEGSLSTYVAGTRVRKDERIYKCKGYPYSLWCKMAAYEPEETAYWNDAWTRAGDCTDALAPTTSPSASPTSSPSKSPTVSPTKSPSASPTSSPSKSPTQKPSQSPTVTPGP
jgi:hypothetical protein